MGSRSKFQFQPSSLDEEIAKVFMVMSPQPKKRQAKSKTETVGEADGDGHESDSEVFKG